MIIEKSEILDCVRYTYGKNITPDSESQFVDDIYESITEYKDILDVFAVINSFEEDNGLEDQSNDLFGQLIEQLHDGKETAHLLFNLIRNNDDYDSYKKLWLFNIEWLTEQQKETVLKNAKAIFDNKILQMDGFYADK